MLKYERYKVYQPRLKLLFFVVNSIFHLGQCSSFHLIYTISRWHITLFVFAMFLHFSGWDLYVGSTIVGGPLLSWVTVRLLFTLHKSHPRETDPIASAQVKIMYNHSINPKPIVHADQVLKISFQTLFRDFVRHFEFLYGLPLYTRSQTPVPGSRFPVPRSRY